MGVTSWSTNCHNTVYNIANILSFGINYIDKLQQNHLWLLQPCGMYLFIDYFQPESKIPISYYQIHPQIEISWQNTKDVNFHQYHSYN